MPAFPIYKIKNGGNKEMKRFLNNIKRKAKNMLSVFTGAVTMTVLMTNQVFAGQNSSAASQGGTSTVTQPLENLKTLVIAIIGAVGVIILAKNVMEFAQAYQQQDSSTMNSALKGIVAGVMMAGISAVLTFLGF